MEGAVVYDEKLYRQVFAGRGRDFLSGHQETAVAGDGHGLPAGMDTLGAHSGRDGPAHHLIVGRIEISSWLPDFKSLGPPALRSGHIHKNQGVRPSAFSQSQNKSHRI